MLRSIRSSLIIRRVRLSGLVIAATLLVAGCASPIRHQVMVFHDWPADLNQRSFKFATAGTDADDLKRRTWESVIGKELANGGFSQSDDPALEISFTFQTRERRIRQQYYHPHFSPYFTFGHSFRWGGLSISGPLWGWHGYPYPVVTTVYEHELNITMKQLRSGEPVKVFEGSSVTRENGVSPVQALPLLVRAILKDFPGQSGVVRTITFEPSIQRK